MSVNIPNGSKVFIGEFDVAKEVTAASNASECVLNVASHNVKVGEWVLFKSGWGLLNDLVLQVGAVDTGTITLKGVDTSNLTRFPKGGGIGSIQRVKTWTQLTQILEWQTSGGEQQYYDFGFLEEEKDRKIPTTRAATSIAIAVADDPTLAGYQAAVKVSDLGNEAPLRLDLKNGGVISYYGYLSVNKTPSLTRNEIMKTSMDFALSTNPVRY
ncbi:phage tail protein [Wielerella bovis]|uniref:phage tail protein n=1 Tax=Wielerella bovis TaxID=2917790 RepID=UPI0020187621|nr:phage tail protein [Wielerella bovis]ULJ59742.1 phage tail protein [Wielerella bovis]